MTSEEKFKAAVKIIQGLPKKGPVTPSVSLQLKFYGLFKQATLGPNTTPKPYMWEVINKAKWDAWKSLGDMTKEEAMCEYVRELNNIVETMAASGNVEEFLVGMEDFYAKVPAEDVDLCIGPTIAKIRARSKTPLPSYPTSRTKSESTLDEDDDNFLDSIDTVAVNDENSVSSTVLMNGFSKDPQNTADILTRTVLTMKSELDDITQRMNRLEERHRALAKRRGLSAPAIAFITLWPVLVNLGLIWLYSRKRKYNS